MEYVINQHISETKPDAVRTIYKPLRYYEPRKYPNTSRYKLVRRIKTSHDIHPNKFIPQTHRENACKEYHESIYNRGISNSMNDKYYEVNNISANRLDVIAQQFYDDSSLWWVIAQANSSIIFDPFNVPAGTILRIPPLSSLYIGGGILDG